MREIIVVSLVAIIIAGFLAKEEPGVTSVELLVEEPEKPVPAPRFDAAYIPNEI